MSYQAIYDNDNFLKIDTGYDFRKFQDFVLNVFYPKVNEARKKEGKAELDNSLFTEILDADAATGVYGEHKWGTIACYFVQFGSRYNFNFELPYAYCLQRRRGYIKV